MFRLFRLEQIFLVFRVWTQYVDVQHLMYWQGQLVCDALFYSTNIYIKLKFTLYHETLFVGLALLGKDIVFRYISLRDFGPLGNRPIFM